MRLSTKTDITDALLSPSVEPGEYTGFLENFTASYNSTNALQNAGSKTEMVNEEMEPLHDIAKEALGISDDSMYYSWMGDANYGQGSFQPALKQQSAFGENIPVSISRLYELANTNDEVKTKFEALGFDMSSLDNAYDTVMLKAVERSQAYQQQYNETANKQAATGVLGDFSGSMSAYMTDPSDVASLFIGINGKANLLKKIAQASSINVGVEVFDYPSVTAWTERVTGSPYSAKEFLADAGLITAGTAALVTLTSIPVRPWINAIQTKIGRSFTPKEQLEAVAVIKEAVKEAQNRQFPEDKTLAQLENKESLDDITNKENFIENDVSNTRHNKKVKDTLAAVLRNDVDGLKSQTVQIDIDDIYALEKQGLVDEVEVKSLDSKTKVTGEAVDEINQGQIVIFEDAAGNRTIIDGGKRVKDAAKAGQKKIYAAIIKETEGFTKEMADMVGRIRNYYDGTIQDYDMKILQKYPELVEAFSIFDPLIKQVKALTNLAARPMIAIEREIIGENVATLVGRYIDDAAEQIAMIDKIKKANISDDESVEKLILESIEDNSLKSYDMSQAEQSVKSLFLENERRQVIDGVLERLRKENITLKNSKKKADIIRREQNGKAIQIIEEYGNRDSEIYGQITKSAQAIANDGNADDAVNIAISDIRTAIDDGSYDSLFYNGQISKSNTSAKINRVSEEFKRRNKDLIAYTEGIISKQLNIDVENAGLMIKDRTKLDPSLLNRTIDFDAEGNKITLDKVLQDLDDMNADLDFIDACRKT